MWQCGLQRCAIEPEKSVKRKRLRKMGEKGFQYTTQFNLPRFLCERSMRVDKNTKENQKVVKIQFSKINLTIFQISVYQDSVTELFLQETDASTRD